MYQRCEELVGGLDLDCCEFETVRTEKENKGGGGVRTVGAVNGMVCIARSAQLAHRSAPSAAAKRAVSVQRLGQYSFCDFQ